MYNVKTLEEFAIKEIQDLREENQYLKEELETCKVIEKNLNKNIEFLRDSYYTLIEKIKKDFKVELKVDTDRDPYIKFENNYIWSSYLEEEYEYYKNVFNLKEKGEEENEQSNSN